MSDRRPIIYSFFAPPQKIYLPLAAGDDLDLFGNTVLLAATLRLYRTIDLLLISTRANIAAV